MLEIILPLAFIACAVLMDIHTIAVGFIVEPFTLEDIAVNVPELSVAAGLIETPVSFVLGAVLPHLHAIAVLHVSEPLARVGCSILEVDFTALLQLGLINILHIEVRIIHREAVIRRGVVMLMRVHLEQLGADPLTCDDSARPCLQPDYVVNVPLVMSHDFRIKSFSILKHESQKQKLGIKPANIQSGRESAIG